MLRLVVLVAVLGLAWLGYDRVDGLFRDRGAELEQSRLQIAQLDEQLRDRDVRITRLGEELTTTRADLVATQLERDEAQLANSYLKIDRRRARLTVLAQGPDPSDASRLRTRLRFQELDPSGEPLGEPVLGEIEGRFAYVESLVIKFSDDHVERGDAWRGQSLCLFRRLFGEGQTPEEGFTLDPVGLEPGAYRDDASPDLTQALWTDFWDYAHDPVDAAEQGVRAMHGEAPFMEMRPGASYLVELRSSGGLTLRRETP